MIKNNLMHFPACLYIFILSCIAGFAQTNFSNDRAKQIVAGVITPEYIQKVAFINGMKTTTYEHRLSSGFTLQRMESDPTNNPLEIHLVTIKNQDGFWDLRPDMAIRMDFRNVKAGAIKMPDFSMEVSYSMQVGVIDGQSYYFITQEYSKKTQAQLLQSIIVLKENENWAAKDIVQVIPAKTIYYIGTNDNMIHGLKTYNGDGLMITQIFYSSINTNLIPDSAFQLPSNLHEVITRSYAEYHRIMPYVAPDLFDKAKISGIKPGSKHIVQLTVAIIILVLPLAILLRSYFRAPVSKS